MNATKATKALSYLRVSGKGQIEGDGFRRQRDAVRRYAKAHGVCVEAEYRDEGISGTTELADRPGLVALLAHVQRNGVRTVLVEKADRLARDLVAGELILRELRELGVRVIAAESGTDLTAADGDATTVLIRQVLGAVSEFEKTGLVGKLRAARERIRSDKGRCEGRKPFGTLAGESDTLKRIRELRRKPRGRRRLSFAKIAAVLDREGRATRMGGAWKPGSVHSVLKRANASE